jgi:crotonobetainyl-CoA:carnitine CoA-transferase CaiB-like acyl-CoA transferase
MDYMANGRILRRQGNRHPFASPHGIYPCAGEDRWCAIAAFTEEQWHSFCQVLGSPDWANDPKFDTLVSRMENADELDQLIGAWTKGKEPQEVMGKMQQRWVPAAIVAKGQDLSENAHLKERGFYKETEYYGPPFDMSAELKGITVAMSVPIRFSETTCQFGPTHRIGEDNDYVYGQILGMSSQEIKRLTEEGVFV